MNRFWIFYWHQQLFLNMTTIKGHKSGDLVFLEFVLLLFSVMFIYILHPIFICVFYIDSNCIYHVLPVLFDNFMM